jgi:hypothetical protein
MPAWSSELATTPTKEAGVASRPVLTVPAPGSGAAGQAAVRNHAADIAQYLKDAPTRTGAPPAHAKERPTPMSHARKLASAALTTCLVAMGGIGTTVLSAGAAHAATCPTAGQIVTDINATATVAGDLTSQLAALTTNSSPSDVQSAAQSAANGLNTMSSELDADTSALNGCPALSSADSTSVANAFDSLAGTTNQTLNTLIGDQPIFAQFGLTAPIASSLRNLEATFDSYAFTLVTVAPSQQGPITDDQNSVNTSLDNAITTYSQLCIPSPLYPTIKPICLSL